MPPRNVTPFDIVTGSRKAFFYFLAKCNEYYRSGHDLGDYRDIIEKHRAANGLAPLLDDPSFFRLIYATLERFNMNQRAARLTSENNLQASIKAHRGDLLELYQQKILSLNHQDFLAFFPILEEIFLGLRVMESRRKIVGVSKTLHFLLPDLVMPIDSTYTLPGFYGYNVYSRSAVAEFNYYKEVHLRSHRALKQLAITDADIDGQGWNTTAPKLIDNALIGFYQYLDHHTLDDFKALLPQLQDQPH